LTLTLKSSSVKDLFNDPEYRRNHRHRPAVQPIHPEHGPLHPQLCAGRASHGFESAPRIFIAGAKEKIRSIPDFRFSGGRVFTEPPVGPEEARALGILAVEIGVEITVAAIMVSIFLDLASSGEHEGALD